MSWISSNLINTVSTWNSKLAEIIRLLLMPPELFNDGNIWQMILNINGAMQAIAYALLVLFFVTGVVKTCGNFSEIKRPEQAFRLFFRFAIAKGIITYGMELLLAIILNLIVSPDVFGCLLIHKIDTIKHKTIIIFFN